jgi:hypothetical protein
MNSITENIKLNNFLKRIIELNPYITLEEYNKHENINYYSFDTELFYSTFKYVNTEQWNEAIKTKELPIIKQYTAFNRVELENVNYEEDEHVQQQLDEPKEIIELDETDLPTDEIRIRLVKMNIDKSVDNLKKHDIPIIKPKPYDESLRCLYYKLISEKPYEQWKNNIR